jgi:hypothetical protein
LFLPPRAALAPESNSRWGLAKATVKIDKNGHERKPTEKSKTGRRMELTLELTRFRGHLNLILTDEEVCGEYSETNRGAENATPSPSLQR